MSAKHFINDPTHLVNSALRALTLTNPSVALDAENKIIYRRPSDAPSQVSIISGGGSGHEPSFVAFVGDGLLSAGVAGTIFASPSAEQIRKAVMSRVDGEKGILVTVMNYTGDVLNFGMAVEKAKAAGLKVEMLVVGDDVGVGRAKAGKVGRRGIAGTVLVHKISGALAARGASLEDVYKVAKLTSNNIVSVGASLEHVHVPGRGPSEETLGKGEIEIGMGIHNEPGSGRATLDLPQLVETMLQQMLDSSDKDRAFLNVNSNEIVLLINNLGGVSVLELGGITAEAVDQLEKTYNIKPARVLAGTYMTSLNGLGFSISILNVVNTNIGGPSMLQLLDDPCEAAGWTAPIKTATWEAKSSQTRESQAAGGEEIKASGLRIDPESAKLALSNGLKRVIAAEPDVTRFDTVVGDGDCGIGLKRGAEAVQKLLDQNPFSGDAVLDLSMIVHVVETTMDGTSGALYAIYLNSLVHALQQASAGDASPTVWGAALKQASESLSKYTPAQPGDRTLVDALQPFVETLNSTGDVRKAAEASRKGAESTQGMQASLGRTVYIGGSGFKKVPDPGAWGLSEFFLGLADPIATMPRTTRNRTFGRFRNTRKKLFPKRLKGGEENEDEMPALESPSPTPALVRDNALPLVGLGVVFPDDVMTCMDGSTEPRAEGATVAVRAVNPEDLPTVPFRDLTPIDEERLHPEALSTVMSLAYLTPEPMEIDAQAATTASPSNDHTDLLSPTPSEQSVQVEPLAAFHLFPCLPSKIRANIWKLNLPGPRLVEIIVRGDPYEEFVPSAERVTNLHVCQESRALALLSHPFSFEVDYNAPLVPFNFESDTLLLGQALSWTGYRIFHSLCNKEDLAKVKRLMVDAALERCEREYLERPFRKRGSGLGATSRPLFTGLVEFTVVFTGNTDTVNWWANKFWFPYLPCHYHGRTSNIPYGRVYPELKQNWEGFFNILTNRNRISPLRCAKFRYGSIIEEQNWDPSIKRWAIPEVSTVGLDEQVIDNFRHAPDHHCWAELIMDRVIDAVFA
ncbi:Dak1 domain-containing protein [Amylocarpus encephaloides]|uniref:Dak1 domain-containing protein n=1 Tax=Amylocarpus encephaloides TaxID=45428 RepID=A0A9P7YL72_9HELO|nr:Dak1 domain-containing protein [Amylocarpus encephaloides]